ncbi:hypothetical protein [Pseudoalteromonas denitrificans]|uniref:Uncharacterized protein n=1 Tax=Pseudoalteromonas denitrificans DSM 6059 TaxID=1123010 RepID=A0A1I1S3A1_9GAMM|nr:hypothetical protein [Pseudoalteromonas denitrificans]SFD40969.1 hypothetical protein SAMN02745724_04436 [Pseudoalteromonas denitrificans DSM 6059]
MTEKESKVNINLSGNEIRLGSTINFFELHPHSDEHWKIKRLIEHKYEVVPFNEAFIVRFGSDLPKDFYYELPKATRLEIELQQSTTFVVDIPKTEEGNDWRFSGDGISLSDVNNFDYQLQTQIKNQGRTLIISINNVRETISDKDHLDFRFIAIRLNQKRGGALNQIYYSQDPRIGVRRPTH